MDFGIVRFKLTRFRRFCNSPSSGNLIGKTIQASRAGSESNGSPSRAFADLSCFSPGGLTVSRLGTSSVIESQKQSPLVGRQRLAASTSAGSRSGVGSEGQRQLQRRFLESPGHKTAQPSKHRGVDLGDFPSGRAEPGRLDCGVDVRFWLAFSYTLLSNINPETRMECGFWGLGLGVLGLFLTLLSNMCLCL